MKNVMLIGKMCSGKTTMADSLKDLGYERVLLAEPVKQVIFGVAEGLSIKDLLEEFVFEWISLTDVQKEALTNLVIEAKAIPSVGPKYRERLQYFGTGARDRVAKDIWIQCLLAKVQKTPDKLFVVDDCRFVNEYQALKEYFTPVVLNLSKKEQEKRMRELYGDYDPEVLKHASEQEFDLIKAFALIDDGPGHVINSNSPQEINQSLLRDIVKGLK